MSVIPQDAEPPSKEIMSHYGALDSQFLVHHSILGSSEMAT